MNGVAQLSGLELAGEPTPRSALLWLMVAAALSGAAFVAVHGTAAPLVNIASNLALGFLPFLWYCRDGNERGFQRSLWWNIGMACFVFPTVFFYLWRTRPKGRRARAMLAALGCSALVLLAGVSGMVAAGLLRFLLRS